jgi:hypothetical protein
VTSVTGSGGPLDANSICRRLCCNSHGSDT